VSTDKERDAERAARFMEDLAADAEEERILGLSDEELIAEMKREGRDPSQVPSTEALLARVKAQAEADGRLRPTESVKEEPVQGPTKAIAAAVEKSVRVRAWRRPWRALGMLAAAAAVAVTLATTMMRREEPLGLMPDAPAADLRRAALEKCEAAAWKECRRLLDQAARKDPAGEREAAVKNAREAIAKAGQ
jgi:hypothetical protein